MPEFFLRALAGLKLGGATSAGDRTTIRTWLDDSPHRLSHCLGYQKCRTIFCGSSMRPCRRSTPGFLQRSILIIRIKQRALSYEKSVRHLGVRIVESSRLEARSSLLTL